MGPNAITPDSGELDAPEDPSNGLHGSVSSRLAPSFSPDGGMVCNVHEEGEPITIHDAINGRLITELPVLKADMVEFSPLGTYLVTWSRPSTAPGNNLCVWHIASAEMVASFSQKQQKKDILQWSGDESVCGHLVTNEVQLMRGDNLKGGIIAKCFHKGMTQFKLSPKAGTAGVSIGVFQPEKGGNPAKAALYTFSGEGTDVQGPTARTTMMNASEANMMWNSTGTSLLCHTSTDVDSSGASYYGATGLFVLTTSALGDMTEKVSQSKDGPIYAVAWSPNGDKFVVCNGVMPCHQTMYNAKAEMVYEFGAAHRNTIAWSPHSRFLCLAGFGNLAGQMDFYDIQKLKKIGTNTSHCSVQYGWSPDSRYFLTASLAPRMNVDNNFRIFKYDGVGPVVEHKFEQAFDVAFLPSPRELYPSRGRSPRREGVQKPVRVIEEKVAIKPAAYRPPGASGSVSGGLADRLRREAAPVGKVKAAAYVPPSRVAGRKIPGMPVGAAPNAKASRTPEELEKETQKKEAKKKADKERKVAEAKRKEEEDAAAAAAAKAPAKAKPVSELTTVEAEKRVKNLKKKLKGIEDLKKKNPAELNDDQRAKIASEGEISAEIAAIEN